MSLQSNQTGSTRDIFTPETGGVTGTASFNASSGSIAGLVVDGVISGVTRASTGVYDVAFATSELDNEYAVGITASDDASALTVGGIDGAAVDYTVDGFTVTTVASGTPRDPEVVRISVLRLSTGTQGPAGPAGDPGTPGTDGNDGADGSNGTNGSVWRDGSGVPSNSLGVDGDYYLRTSNGDVYFKASGAYSIVGNIKGATGSSGSNGTNGSVWRDGSGAPSSGLGANGDYYLDDDTGDVYLKSAGSYSLVANISGSSGVSTFNTRTGAVTLSALDVVDVLYTYDTVDPTVTDDAGEVGSRWVNTTSGDEFRCDDNSSGAAVWTPVGSSSGGGGGSGSASARAKVGASFSIPTATDTLIQFDTVDFDTASAITTGSSWKYTAPSTGKYRVSAAVLLASNTNFGAGTYVEMDLRKNGSTYCSLAFNEVLANTLGGSAYVPQLIGSATISLTAGDYIDVVVNQTSGFTQTSNAAPTASYISVDQIGGGNSDTNWVSFTPTGAWSTNTSYTGRWRRIGPDLKCVIHVDLTGAPDATPLLANLPSGLHIDYAKILSGTASYSVIGAGLGFIHSMGNRFAVAVFAYGNAANDTVVRIAPWLTTGAASTNTSDTFINQTVPAAWANTDMLDFEFCVPIAGWGL